MVELHAPGLPGSRWKVRSSYALRPALWREVDEATWGDWHWQQRHRLRSAGELERVLALSVGEGEAIGLTAERFRLGLTPHYVSLIEPGVAGDPVRLQAVPQLAEMEVQPFELEDPLAEEAHMPVPGITHRYPDRVLFYVSHHCPVYCRHCTRKRKVSAPESAPRRDAIGEGLAYISEHEEVRDVLVSGGDPLSLSNARLGEILRALRAIEHVDVIRLGTRNPVTLPQRIDGGLLEVLRGVAPVYVNTHFNHPAEATRESEEALRGLLSAGAVMGNQMVLLRGVNDDAAAVEWLNRWLLRQGVRPYYMFQADMAEGITHFRTPLRVGLEIMRALRGRVSGLGVPQLVIDLPGGGGKVPLLPEYLEERLPGGRWVFRNWAGERYVFQDVEASGVVEADEEALSAESMEAE